MKNPLRKRYARELRKEKGKYIALFLFLVFMVGLISGFLVADNSMKSAYDESFEKYNIEDGHFTLASKMSLEDLEEDENIKIYEMFYKNISLENQNRVRVYKPRDEVNKVCLIDGSLPEKGEVALDRLYCENNNIEIGDEMKIGGEKLTVSGFVALSDYSALFENNADSMFNASRFSVAITDEETFDKLNSAEISYTYAWVNENQSLNEDEKRDLGDDIKEELQKSGVLTDFLIREDNQAISFTGEDMGGDKAMMITLLYVVMAILAFVFAVTTKSTIEQEAGSIGTLRASGYRRGELIRHYITMPTIITLVGAAAGNVLGYTCMKNLIVDMYYHSYSLTTYKTLWNMEAFVLTTLVPCIIILLINLLVIGRMMNLSPLAFLRHDLSRRKKKKVMTLKRGSFLSRFRKRVMIQNIGVYLILTVGIFFASLLLIFGMIMTPLLNSFKEDVLDSQIAKYQYVLKAQVETEDETAEKYAAASLNYGDENEEIKIFGIEKDSNYIDPKVSSNKNEIVISRGYMEKYRLEEGDVITLEDDKTGDKYKFTVSGSYDYAAALSGFISLDNFNKVFDKDASYFTGYFSDKKLDDIDEDYIATTITAKDLTAISDQLSDSMGSMFPIISVFSVLIYIILMYLLAKLVIEKNQGSISMVKILGYSNKEVSKLYNRATTMVVVIALIVTLPLASKGMELLFRVFMEQMNGWMYYYTPIWLYPAVFFIGIGCYLLVSLLQRKKTRKIPLSFALKNIE